MDSYTPLLKRTQVPQPSLQKIAVIAIFEKLRSASPNLGPDSDPGRYAITYCLNSTSPPVVDQAVRELCRLVKDSEMDIYGGLLELQSALEACNCRFVTLFVKALGFIVNVGFRKNPSLFQFRSTDTHPYVKILSCRTEVQSELLQQVVIFLVQNKHVGMVEICEFFRPFLNYTIIRMQVSATFSSFIRNLVSSISSLCCSFPKEAVHLIKLLMGCIAYFPCRDTEDLAVLFFVAECILDAYVVVLSQLSDMRLLFPEVQLCGVELLRAMFSLINDILYFGGAENISKMARRLLVIQKEMGLRYVPELSSVSLSLLIPLMHSNVEHEQLAIMKVLLFLLEWKSESGHSFNSSMNGLNEEILFIFPIVNILSSPCKLVKDAAISLLSFLEKMLLDSLSSPKKGQSMEGKFPAVSKPESLLYKFLLHLWFQDQSSTKGTLYLNFVSTEISAGENGHSKLKPWASLLGDYSLHIFGKMKSSLPLSLSEELFVGEISLVVSSVASVFLMHQKLGNSSANLLAIIANMKPEFGIASFLLVLFYNHIFSVKEKGLDPHGMPLKLIALIPSLASHSEMVPLVIQTILPMLHRDAKPVLYATAIRLLCKTWEINDRVFGSLQGILLPEKFDEFSSKQEIIISKAASVRDVCKRNPDRGVDLVLSVAACIENGDPLVQSLGLQSLAHLCEADVIDFYTAWDVIVEHVVKYRENATLAYSLCLLLQWGALDAEVYAEPATNILKILWEVGTSKPTDSASLWAKARSSAFLALSKFEVEYIIRSIPNFKDMNVDFLTSETDTELLQAIEEFEARVMHFEYINRRRLVKQKRVPRNKIEKLLDVFPQIMFRGGNKNEVRELPGAALFLFSVAPTDINKRGLVKGIKEVNVEFEDAFLEIASALKLSRNILIALISIQSWKPFMRRWMKVQLMLHEPEAHSKMLDKSSNAATYILKTLSQIAEERVPSCSENCALAIGAFCSVFPLSAHLAKYAASKFLLGWLFQWEHEYRQWSAAISLGLISNCLHVTDHRQKSENINALIEVAFKSKSTLVKGACAVGLGFSCQDQRRVDSDGSSPLSKETFRVLEVELLRKIIGALSVMICQFSQSSADVLMKLSSCIPDGRDDNSDPIIPIDLVYENSGDMEDDIWGVIGLTLGLASSVRSLYRSGAHNAVLIIKDWLFSHIPRISPSLEKLDITNKHGMILATSSCLSLPIVVAFCQQMELIEDMEIQQVVNGSMELASELAGVENSDAFHQSLLMSSCIGLGNLLCVILNGGLHPLKVDSVESTLALFRKSYSTLKPSFVHFGGMLGVVNALGAGAGILVEHVTSTKPDISSTKKESSIVMGPLLSNPVMEKELTALVQEIFLVAQNSDDHRLREFAAWALSFLRHSYWFRQGANVENTSENVVGSKLLSQRFPEDSIVFKLSSWLVHLNPEMASIAHVNTVRSVLRCLMHSSGLPEFDWGIIIRRCMRYEDQVAKFLAKDPSIKKGALREDCLFFSLHFGNQFDSLLSLLDELSELSRFRMLELNLQSFICLHLADLMKSFSNSRNAKLFDDLSIFLSCLVSSDSHTPEGRSLLCVSCWKGLHLCLDNFSLEVLDYASNMEKCMEVLFYLLPRNDTYHGSSLEWSEAVRCLGKARQSWLSKFLQVSEMMTFKDENIHYFDVVKKIEAKVCIVRSGSLPFDELGKLKACILNSRSEVVWSILIEVAATLRNADDSVKRKWLLDTVQISCVTTYPSTALQFLGLLCGSWCRYMPVLVVDRDSVLSDLPVTLTSLLLESTWGTVVEPVVSSLWTLTERIHGWRRSLLLLEEEEDGASEQQIDKSENDKAAFLLLVVHHACVSLKQHLPLEKQLRLANMVLH